eukprot:s1267_g43.t1
MGFKRQADPGDVEEIPDDEPEVKRAEVPRVTVRKEQAMASRFSPAAEAIDDSCCYARVKIGRAVRQCAVKRQEGWFCPEHTWEDRRPLGRVDGVVPKVQLPQLLREAARSTDPEAERRSQRKVLRSASLQALDVKELSRFGSKAVPQLLDTPHAEVVKNVMQQQEDDLWQEVMRVRALDQAHSTASGDRHIVFGSRPGPQPLELQSWQTGGEGRRSKE